MIASLTGVPRVSFIEIRQFFREACPANFLHASSRYPKGYAILKPDVVTALITDRFAYCDSWSAFDAVHDRLTASDAVYHVLVHGDETSLHEHQVALHYRGEWTIDDVRGLIAKRRGCIGRPTRAHDMEHAASAPMRQVSFLQLVYPLFYRVADKAERTALQSQVYSFLAGRAKRPVTNIRKLDMLLASPTASQLREAVAHARQHGLEPAIVAYPQVDPYALRFVHSTAVNKPAKRKRGAV